MRSFLSDCSLQISSSHLSEKCSTAGVKEGRKEGRKEGSFFHLLLPSIHRSVRLQSVYYVILKKVVKINYVN